MQISDNTAQLTTELNSARSLVRDIIGRETRSRTGEDSKLGSRLITLRQFATCYIFRKRQMPMQARTDLTATVIMKPLLMLVELLR
jgi:hypothetical protein